jgi:hypothetical protein
MEDSTAFPSHVTSEALLPEAHLHYNTSEKINLIELIKEIASDVSSRTYLHDWDSTVTSDPVRSLIAALKDKLRTSSLIGGHYLVDFTNVERVHTVYGQNYRRPVTGRSTALFESILFTNVGGLGSMLEPLLILSRRRVGPMPMFSRVLTRLPLTGPWKV